MSSINPVSSLASQQTATTSTTTDSTKTLGENDFLSLLVAQLQNQDPTNPVDNTQFVSQLATFSSLQQLISINGNVATLATDASANSSTTASASDASAATAA
jgi:flagellar basal-body rod modification protein FlgD